MWGVSRGCGEHLAQHRVESDRCALVANFGGTGCWELVTWKQQFYADYIDDVKHPLERGWNGVKVRIYSIRIPRTENDLRFLEIF